MNIERDAGCCPSEGAKGTTQACPSCGSVCKPVALVTVAALTWKPLPQSNRFWLCRTRDCRVVYFDPGGNVFGVEDLKVQPGFKGDGDLVCYCYGFSQSDLAATNGDSAHIEQQIRTAARNGLCACETRHPSGNCCLGEIAKARNSRHP